MQRKTLSDKELLMQFQGLRQDVLEVQNDLSKSEIPESEIAKLSQSINDLQTRYNKMIENTSASQLNRVKEFEGSNLSINRVATVVQRDIKWAKGRVNEVKREYENKQSGQKQRDKEYEKKTTETFLSQIVEVKMNPETSSIARNYLKQIMKNLDKMEAVGKEAGVSTEKLKEVRKDLTEGNENVKTLLAGMKKGELSDARKMDFLGNWTKRAPEPKKDEKQPTWRPRGPSSGSKS